jgi:CO/xanthine dehydrogenase FAD-binding subunit
LLLMLKAVPKLHVYTPTDVNEVLKLLSEGNGRRGLFAGGTDMIPYIRRGRVSLEEVIDLSGVQGLSFVKFEDGVFRVGALTTVQELAESPLIPERYQSIKGLVYYFGAETTRNMATVGGNLASGGERDIPAVLTSLDGWVEVASLEGVRRAHPLQLELKPWELIIEAAFNDWGEGSVSWFRKFEKRASNGIGVVTVSIAMKVVDGVVEKLRVVLNRVEGRRMGRLNALEEYLTGMALDEDVVEKAVDRFVYDIKPASDFRASSDFRRHVSKVLVKRGLLSCWHTLTKGGYA